MIRRIQLIKSFGVFANFQWPENVSEFKQFNLIYGWNYSGKTTLSRAFRCFEQRQPHADFADAQVQLKAADGAIHSLSAPETAPVVKVFNSDFVRENLSFDDGSATPILVLGAEDIAKQATLKAKKAERDALVLSKVANETTASEKEATIDKALSKSARDLIKNPLGMPNYERPNFQPKVNECRSDPEKYILNDETLRQYLAVYRSTDKKEVLSAKTGSLSSIEKMKRKTEMLLAKVVATKSSIPRLTEDPAVEKWVNEGRPFHVGKDSCQFCAQSLPSDLLDRLAGHFSAEYETLMGELDALAKGIKSASEEDIPLESKADFYAELSERFMVEKRRLDKLLRARKSVLGTLAKAVADKQTKAFTSVTCPVVDDPSGEIASATDAINKIIVEHNNRTAEFDKKRQEAFAKIERHYAASFVRDHKYNETLQQIAGLRTTIDEQGKTLGALDTTINGLERELSEASKGAERINELLSAYFGKDDLRVVVLGDKRFQIVRGESVVAKNLSEGEKTAIAFAYFITRVQDGRHPLADTRVIIDDPISSLDANHLFNTYALIKTQLIGCRQLFIATHSFEFYNLIREWVSDEEDTKKSQANWKKWGVFYVRRTDDGNAVLEEIPKELLRFKSEYHYLFSTLYHFDKAAGGFDSLLSLPNVVRRFMEAFGGIMIPRWTGLHAKMAKLFPDEVVRERVWKFINHYSHNTTITRSLTIPDTSECKAVVQACLKAVRDWDAEYFADLEAEVTT